MCGFRLSDTLPPTYLHMLAFRLHLSLMTDGSFPLPAIGLVHIANRTVQHRPRSRRRVRAIAELTPAHPADAIVFGVRNSKRDTQHLDGLLAR